MKGEYNMHLSEKGCKKVFLVMLMILIAVSSVFLVSNNVERLPLYQESVETLEQSNDTVMKLSVATLGISVGITLLPDDLATPLADSLADMQKYFVIILGMVFLEKLILTQGISVIFKFVVPVICAFFAAYVLSEKELLKSIAGKFLGLALALVLFVPASTLLSTTIGAGYQASIAETVDVVSSQEEAIDELTTANEEEQGFFDKATNLLKTAISGFTDLFENFKKVIEKCVTAIAMLLVINCGVPVLTFVLLVWVLKQLFQFSAPGVPRVITVKADKDSKEVEE